MDSFGDLQDLYQQVILDHSKSPRNFGELEGAQHRGDGHNPLCGDQITVFVNMDGDAISDVKFTGKGCAICTASASMMTQTVKNKSVDQANSMFESFHAMVTGNQSGDEETLGKLAVFQGVCKYPIRVKCASLPWHTLKNSLAMSQDVATTE